MILVLSCGAVVCGGTLMCSAAAAESVFPVAVQERGADAGTGQAVLIAEELLLLDAGLVDMGDQYIVEHPETGARLVASLFDSNEDSGLALLSVPSLEGDPVTVALEQSGPGRQVHLLRGRAAWNAPAPCIPTWNATDNYCIDSLRSRERARPGRRS